MTEDEKRQQKANLLLEYQEAQEHLAHLRRRANTTTQPFKNIHTWLTQLGSFEQKSFYGEDPSAVKGIILADVGAFRKKLDLDAVINLADEIKLATESLNKLAREKEQFGLH